MHLPSDNLTDERLLTLLQQDRKDAFEVLFKKYYHLLWRHSVKYVRDKDTAEEIVQEFFVYLWEKRETLTIPDSVSSYFHVAVKNRSFNHLQKKFHLSIPIEENTDILHYETDHLLTEELTTHIERAINQLPDKCKIIFLLSRKSDLTYKEIARQLDISVKTVEAQMGIALKKLRDYLLKQGVSLIVLSGFIKEFFDRL